MEHLSSSRKEEFNSCSGTLPIRTYRPSALASYRLKKSPLTLPLSRKGRGKHISVLSRAKVNSPGRWNDINCPKRTYLPKLASLFTHHCSLKKKAAFTLSEILITLGIIGAVAAMTIPVLVNKYRDRQYVTSLKKAVSILDNAYRLAIYENGGTNDFGYLDPEYVPLPPEEGSGVYNKNGNYNSDIFFQAMSKHLNIIKDCGKNSDEGCFPETIKSPFRDETWNLIDMQGKSRRFFILSDGMSIGITPSFAYIDVNGLKDPNTLGVDVFQIAFNDNSIGWYDDGSQGTLQCYSNEFTCSSWVIVNDNIDYIHCNDLNWKTKTKCK